ncbi:MAG TPA: hypothetical protein DCM05_05060 [Elusimicrobia bacterium]|nr:hypothetical protein [Elusimicrobiota bacterium]
MRLAALLLLLLPLCSQAGENVFISYEKGVERLFIEFGPGGPSERRFFIPAEPKDVRLGLADSLPELRGSKVLSAAKADAQEMVEHLALSQLQLLPVYGATAVQWSESFLGLLTSNLRGLAGGERKGLGLFTLGSKPSPRLDEPAGGRVDNEGVSLELGPSGIGSVVRVHFRASDKNRAIAVEFPSARRYAPLQGLGEGPLVVRADGFMKPRMGGKLHARYFIQGRRTLYTRIRIDTLPAAAPEGFWLERGAPARTRFLSAFVRHPRASLVLLSLFASLLAGLALGRFVFGWTGSLGWAKSAALGLLNTLTSLPLLLACLLKKPFLDRRKLLYAFFFPVAYWVALELVAFLLVGKGVRVPWDGYDKPIPGALGPGSLSLAVLALLGPARAFQRLSSAESLFREWLKTTLWALALLFLVVDILPKSAAMLFGVGAAGASLDPFLAGFSGADLALLAYGFIACGLVVLALAGLSLVPKEEEEAWATASLAVLGASVFLSLFRPNSPPLAACAACGAVVAACLSARGRSAGRIRAGMAAAVLVYGASLWLGLPKFYWPAQKLAGALKSRDAVIAWSVAERLEAKPAAEVVAAVSPLLSDSSRFVRRYALAVLAGTRSVAASALPQALRLLREDPDYEVRRVALRFVHEVHGHQFWRDAAPRRGVSGGKAFDPYPLMAREPVLHEGVLPALSGALQCDPDERMRSAAASELGHFAAPSAAPALVEAALRGDPASGLGRRALRAASRFPPKTLLPLLVKGLADPRTRLNAAAVVESLGPKGRGAASALERAFAAEKRPEVRSALRSALGAADRARLAELLSRGVNDPDRRVSAEALQALGALGLSAPKSALPALTRAMRQNADPLKRLDAAILLRQWKDEEAGIVLFGSMNDGRLSELDRFRAALALTESGDPAAVSSFLRLLGAGDPALKRWAAGALGRLRTKESIPALAEAAKSEDLEVCAAAAGALTRLGAPEAVPGLLRMLASPGLQASALRLLGELGPAGAPAVPALKKILLEAEDEGARRSAGRALVRIAPKAAGPILDQASRLWKNQSLKKEFERMRREAEASR